MGTCSVLRASQAFLTFGDGFGAWQLAVHGGHKSPIMCSIKLAAS